MNHFIEKNILDLRFQKYLVVASTAIIIFFTYLIGVTIAIIAKQIIGIFSIMLVIFLSVAIGSLCIAFFFHARSKMRKILTTLKEM